MSVSDVAIRTASCIGDGDGNNKDLTRLFRYLSGYDAE